MTDYYNKSSNPQNGAFGSSATIRAEFASIETNISGKLPVLTSNAGKILAVNAGETGLEAVVTTGTGNAVRANSPTLTTPVISSPTGLVKADVGLGNVDNTSNATERAATATLINKTVALGSNTVSGTLAQFNTAVTDADLASLAGSETLTNKTLTSPVINTPTGIVKGDVGLGNVDNTSDANKPVSTAQALADTAIGSAAAADATSKANAAAAASTPVAHATNTSNPHSVTKTQVGLSNVDNTSDVNKPVSTAQALADTAIGSAAAADATSKANAAIVTAEAYADALSISVIKLNPRIITSDFTVPSGYNASSVGPIFIADGVGVTISDGSNWSIV